LAGAAAPCLKRLARAGLPGAVTDRNARHGHHRMSVTGRKGEWPVQRHLGRRPARQPCRARGPSQSRAILTHDNQRRVDWPARLRQKAHRPCRASSDTGGVARSGGHSHRGRDGRSTHRRRTLRNQLHSVLAQLYVEQPEHHVARVFLGAPLGQLAQPAKSAIRDAQVRHRSSCNSAAFATPGTAKIGIVHLDTPVELVVFGKTGRGSPGKKPIIVAVRTDDRGVSSGRASRA